MPENVERPNADEPNVVAKSPAVSARDLHGSLLKLQDVYAVEKADELVDLERYYFRH